MALPGQDLVARGIGDLRAGRRTVESLLVSTARSRLIAAGFEVPPALSTDPWHDLYSLLELEDPAGAHARHGALVRRLVGFARAAEHARAA